MFYDILEDHYTTTFKGTKNKIVTTLVTVSVETSSISDWMTPELCADFSETLSFKYPQKKTISWIQVRWGWWPWTSFFKQRRLPLRLDCFLQNVTNLLALDLALSWWNMAEFTRMPYLMWKDATASLRLTWTSEVTVPLINTGPNIPAFANARHYYLPPPSSPPPPHGHPLSLSGCRGLATVNVVFFEV
jgi:hypothetical protein